MNVPAIQAFVTALDPVLSDLIQLRDDLIATDRFWPVLDATAKASIHTTAANRFDAMKAALALIQVP